MEDLQGHVHDEATQPPEPVKDFPSILAMGLTHLPGAVLEKPPTIKRWNAGWEAKYPHSLHRPQHLDRPHLNPEPLAEHLLRHSSCKSLFGPTHTCFHLAARAEAGLPSSPNVAKQAAQIHENSLHVLQNLKQRTFAENLLNRTRAQQTEWEKNFWLGQVLRQRDTTRAQKFGESSRAHAATVQNQQQLSGEVSSPNNAYPSLPLSPTPGTSPQPHRYPGGGETTYPYPFTRLGQRTLGITQRTSLSSLGSVHQRHFSQTFLPPEVVPRRPPREAPALTYLRGQFWSRIEKDGHPPSPPLPGSPPLLTTHLSPRVEGGGGACG